MQKEYRELQELVAGPEVLLSTIKGAIQEVGRKLTSLMFLQQLSRCRSSVPKLKSIISRGV